MRPLRRQLTGLRAWITGQRKDQSPGTRAAVPVVQVDPAFQGADGGPGSLVKFNPLSNVSSAEVWNFLRIMVRAPCGRRVARPLLAAAARRACRAGRASVADLSISCSGMCWGVMGLHCSPLQLLGAECAHLSDQDRSCGWEARDLTHLPRARACPRMSCTRAATSPLAASRARARCCPTSTSERGAGGGRRAPGRPPLPCGRASRPGWREQGAARRSCALRCVCCRRYTLLPFATAHRTHVSRVTLAGSASSGV